MANKMEKMENALVLSEHGDIPQVFFPARRLYIHPVSTKLSIPDDH